MKPLAAFLTRLSPRKAHLEPQPAPGDTAVARHALPQPDKFTAHTTRTLVELEGETTPHVPRAPAQAELSPWTQAVQEANQNGPARLLAAIEADDPDQVASVLRLCPLLNAHLDDGDTPLQTASHLGALKVLKFLLSQNGIDPNKADRDGWTPLHQAAKHGRLDVATELLKHPRIQIDLRMSDGATPFLYAMRHDQLAMARLLLSRGADIHLAKHNGRSPLHAACEAAGVQTVAWLLKQPELLQRHGQKIDLPTVLNQRTADGETPLFFAAEEGRTETVQCLLDAGADPELDDILGDTPLSSAVRRGHLDAVQLLLPLRKADINTRFITGETLFWMAIDQGQLAVAKFLLDQGARPTYSNKNGATPLHAAARGKLLTMRWLTAKIAATAGTRNAFDPGDCDGRTPLLVAIREGNERIAAHLLRQPDVSPNGCDHRYWAPVHHALRLGLLKTLQLLLRQPRLNLLQTGPANNNVLHYACMATDPLPLLNALHAQLSAQEFQQLREARNAWGVLPVSVAAQHGAGDAVIAMLTPTHAAKPMAPRTANPFLPPRCWVVTGPDLKSRDPLVQMGAQGGLLMRTEGDGTVDLSWNQLKTLFREGDTVDFNCHAGWDAQLKTVVLELSEFESVPLVDMACMLIESGVRDATFSGCEVGFALTAVRNRLQRDPTMLHPMDKATGYASLAVRTIGLKKETLTTLNRRSAALGMEDRINRLKNPQADSRALLERSAQPVRTLTWNTRTAAFEVSHRKVLDARHLGQVSAPQAREIKEELLFLHAFHGHVGKVKALLAKHHVDVNLRAPNGATALMLACMGGHDRVVELLLARKADVHLVDAYGESALFYACEEEQVGCARRLLASGARTDPVTPPQGLFKPPLHVAVKRGYTVLVKRLLDAGANPHTLNGTDQNAWDVAEANDRALILKLLPPRPVPTV